MQNPTNPLIVDITADTFEAVHDAVFELVKSLPDPGVVVGLAVDEDNCRVRVKFGPTTSSGLTEARERKAVIAELADALLKRRVLH